MILSYISKGIWIFCSYRTSIYQNIIYTITSIRGNGKWFIRTLVYGYTSGRAYRSMWSGRGSDSIGLWGNWSYRYFYIIRFSNTTFRISYGDSSCTRSNCSNYTSIDGCNSDIIWIISTIIESYISGTIITIMSSYGRNSLRISFDQTHCRWGHSNRT